MSQVNPTLVEIRDILQAQLQDLNDKTVSVNGYLQNIDNTQSILLGGVQDIRTSVQAMATDLSLFRQEATGSLANIDIGVQDLRNETRDRLDTLITYTGDIRVAVIDLPTVLSEVQGKLQQIIDKTTEAANTLDIFNTNTAGNFLSLLNFLEIMNQNNALNTTALIDATCGDCTNAQPPIEQGAICRQRTLGDSGSGVTVEIPTSYFVGPGSAGAVGDTGRVRVLTTTRPMRRITVYNGTVASATSYPLIAGGSYVNWLIESTTLTFVFEPVTPGPFNAEVTICYIPAPE